MTDRQSETETGIDRARWRQKDRQGETDTERETERETERDGPASLRLLGGI